MHQPSLFAGPSGPATAERLALPGADAVLYPCFLATPEADALLEQLKELPGWRQDDLTLFGRQVAIPRLHRWFADSGEPYRWSGLQMVSEAFPPCLNAIRQRLSDRWGDHFNSALANWYRDGRDSVSWHSDDEPELGPQPQIASLSLGAERKFQFRRKDCHRQRLSLRLPHGSLLLMSGQTQTQWQHCLPKSSNCHQARLNLTFRRILKPLRPSH